MTYLKRQNGCVKGKSSKKDFTFYKFFLKCFDFFFGKLKTAIEYQDIETGNNGLFAKSVECYFFVFYQI